MYYKFKEEDLKKSCAVIVGINQEGLTISAAASKLNSKKATALEVLKEADSQKDNINILTDMYNQGHKYLLEHTWLNVAFNNVSAVAKQFIIEHRLLSFSVEEYGSVEKSDFYIPNELTKEHKKKFETLLKAQVKAYNELKKLGIPLEECKYVLPYNYLTNFYLSANAREWLHLICTLIYGIGKENEELFNLGTQLKEQFEKIFPEIINAEKDNYQQYGDDRYMYDDNDKTVLEAKEVVGGYEIVGYPQYPESMLFKASKYNSILSKKDKSIRQIVTGQRPKELEIINFTFLIKNISLLALAQITRHRMQTLVIPNLVIAIKENKYIIPEGIKQNAEALAIYKAAYANNTQIMQEYIDAGEEIKDLTYFALCGNVLDIYLNINARELKNFFSVRTCESTPWEIRDLARSMLGELKKYSPDIFSTFGPSCYEKGKCGEGKNTCGKTEAMQELFASPNNLINKKR